MRLSCQSVGNVSSRSLLFSRLCCIQGFYITTKNYPEKLEEENLSSYSAADFYPVHIGEVFNLRYKVLGKLGYGANSTVWLSEDIRSVNHAQVKNGPNGLSTTPLHRYNTLKVYTRSRGQTNNEVDIYQHISEVSSSHLGKNLIRTILDSFEIIGRSDTHHCLVHKPLWISLFSLQQRHPTRKFTLDLLRASLTPLLLALDFLHTECHIVHTGVEIGL